MSWDRLMRSSQTNMILIRKRIWFLLFCSDIQYQTHRRGEFHTKSNKENDLSPRCIPDKHSLPKTRGVLIFWGCACWSVVYFERIMKFLKSSGDFPPSQRTKFSGPLKCKPSFRWLASDWAVLWEGLLELEPWGAKEPQASQPSHSPPFVPPTGAEHLGITYAWCSWAGHAYCLLGYSSGGW